jgi:rsbT co-antagonist protein RsbR
MLSFGGAEQGKIMEKTSSHIHTVLKKYGDEILTDWITELAQGTKSDRRIGESELTSQAREFLSILLTASSDGKFGSAAWAPIQDFLDGISRSRAAQGFSSGETATFVFSFKKPLFERLRKEFGKSPQELADGTWAATELLDKLGLHTVTSFQKAREDIINRQQQELIELSTPVVKLWDGVLALPMIGTLDSARTQLVMETLLQRIVETGSEIAIIDITGVPTVDTLTAQHLLKTVTAIRLMGADCIISGIRPQIAQTIVHLGIDLEGVTTKATLADALAVALKQSGFSVSRAKS